MKYQSSFKKNRSLYSLLNVGFWCLVIVASLIISHGGVYAAQVTLAWDASVEATGYKIYYGTASNNYTSVVDAGPNLTYTFADLPDGITHYFAATAYDVSYLESDYSTEIIYNPAIQKDILWRNSSTGVNVIWYMDGATWTGGWASLPTVADTSWTIIDRCDFNSDGKADILWRNTISGANVVWYMDGATWTGGWASLPTVATTWNIVGTADFNSDGKADILWRNSSTGVNVIWYMDGATWTGGWASLLTVAAPWNIVGTADFNSDGKADILWRNNSTGVSIVWYMDGATWTGGSASLPIIAAPWSIASTTDFNGDGKADILWRNTTSGANVVWYMDGATWTGWTGGWANLPTVADTNWKIVRK